MGSGSRFDLQAVIATTILRGRISGEEEWDDAFELKKPRLKGLI